MALATNMLSPVEFRVGVLLLCAAIADAWLRLVVPESSFGQQRFDEEEDISWIDPPEDAPDPTELLSFVHAPSPGALSIHRTSRALLDLTKDLMSFTPRSARQQQDSYSRLHSLQELDSKQVSSLLREQGITPPQQVALECGPATRYYRTMDGSCNNPHYPCWGKAEEAYQRWLPPDYANGIDMPRRGHGGRALPGARQVYQWVSGEFQQSAGTVHAHFSSLLVVWGQVIAHEMALTPTVTVKSWDGQSFKDEKPKCCNSSSPHPECMPIVLDYSDSYYPPGHCMDLVRSVAHAFGSCQRLSLGHKREQMNQLTAFIDASLVYGSSEEEMRSLREYSGKGAKLIMDYSTRWSYPIRKSKKCKAAQGSCDNRCFLVGEKRANENPALGALHTLLVREHNRLVDAFSTRSWSEETKFHVVRKIVGAQMQKITYGEYLPLILGGKLTNVLQLSAPSSKPYRYDPLINPTMYNVFAAAAFRYGHSMVGTRMKRGGRRELGSPLLSQDFFSMDEFCKPEGDPVSRLLSGQAEQSAQKVDCFFSRELTNHLFAKEPGGMGLDIFSINIQRGRDHGVPSYNRWREACGLPKARDFSDLRANIPEYLVDRLQAVYGPGNVDNIDLYVGGISEIPVNDGLLGATFTCIVANQFKNLKFGDRFWYENGDHLGAFTREQIQSLGKSTLSSLLCLNSNIGQIQAKAFLKESSSNPKLPCRTILQLNNLDLNLWP